MFHLPDLPNAGYATTREKQLTDAVMNFMRSIERDRLRLLTIVLDGKEKWRKVAKEVWGALRVDQDHQLVDSIFSYFELQACPARVQVALLRYQKNPQKWRELMNFAQPQIEREREALRLHRKWA